MVKKRATKNTTNKTIIKALHEAKSLILALREECEHFDDECGNDDWYMADDCKSAIKLINSALKEAK